MGGLTVTVREICTDWIGPQGSGMTSVMFFDATTSVATQRTGLQAFWTAWKANLSNQYSYTIRTTGRDLDTTTGGLFASWSEATVKTGTGTVAVQPVADHTQVLVQWHTNAIVGGRFLRGRTFVPGLTVGTVINGNINSASIGTMNGYGTSLIASGAAFGVWHRPTAGAGGFFDPAVTCTVWPELAVLRRRRK